MRSFGKKMLSLRFPVAVLVLLLTFGVVFTVFAVTVDPDELQPVGSDDGFNITFSVTFEGNVDNKTQTLTFLGESFDEDGSNPATDKTWDAGDNYSTVRHYSSDVTNCIIDVKSNNEVMLKDSYNDFKVRNSDTTGSTWQYCENASEVCKTSQVNNHAYAVIKNPQKKDLLIQLHYSKSVAISNGYAITIVPKGDYGPYIDNDGSDNYQGSYIGHHYNSLDNDNKPT